MRVTTKQLSIAGRLFEALTPVEEIAEHSPAHGAAWSAEAQRYGMVADLDESEIEARRAAAEPEAAPSDDDGPGDADAPEAGGDDDEDDDEENDEGQVDAISGPAGDDRATSGARALASSHDLDLATVRGTGAGGRITKSDVERVIGERTR